jgi:hypothetical protein
MVAGFDLVDSNAALTDLDAQRRWPVRQAHLGRCAGSSNLGSFTAISAP